MTDIGVDRNNVPVDEMGVCGRTDVDRVVNPDRDCNNCVGCQFNSGTHIYRAVPWVEDDKEITEDDITRHRTE